VTGTCGNALEEPEWSAFSPLVNAGGTLVVLMGVANRQTYVNILLASGARPDTPVAAIERATTPTQAIVRTTLAELPHCAIVNPATIVIGHVVRVGADLDAAVASALADA
jgi:siroheme synthase